MNGLVCYDVNGNTLNELYQWEVDRTILISGADITTVPQVHFANARTTNALPVAPTLADGILSVDVPDILLQQAEVLYIYLVYGTDNELRTEYAFRIPVYPRKKPAEYTYSESDLISLYSLEQRVSYLEQHGSGGSGGASFSVDGEVLVLNNS